MIRQSLGKRGTSRFYLLALALTIPAACNTPSKQGNLNGAWAVNCDAATTLDITKDSNVTITVNQNQITVEARVREASKQLNIFYIAPAEVGVGAKAIKWESISTQKAIGSIRFSERNTIFLSWDGFFDSKKQTRVWAKEAEFWNDGKAIKLTKCP